jgi:hypothetical protein
MSTCLSSVDIDKGGFVMRGKVTSLLLILLALGACGPSGPPLLPEVKSFLSKNVEYGDVKSTEAMPNWRFGKRQQVRTNSGTFLFYIRGDEVISVWRYTANDKVRVYHKK